MKPVSNFEGSIREYERCQRTLADASAHFGMIEPIAPCISHAKGAIIWDIDGNRYVDYAMTFGTLILGHSPEEVFEAVRNQLNNGIGYEKSHRLQTDLAEAICRTVPSAEQCIISNTGSEAVHVAVRIARAATGRRRVIKFVGHYHGWFDSILISPPGRTGDQLGSAGQDPAATEAVTVCPWNDLTALQDHMADDVAAVIMEPVHANGGCLEPLPGYLESVRRMTSANGTMLIFDETVTGYRLSLGGAQQYYGVMPDLTVLGKALGGGFPISAVCGPADSFNEVVSSNVSHMGTFNANVVSATAAVTVLDILSRDPDFYKRLDQSTSKLATLFEEEGRSQGFPITVNYVPGLLHAFVGDRPVLDYSDACSRQPAYRTFSSLLVSHGVHVRRDGIMCVTLQHGEEELEMTATAVRMAAQAVSGDSAECRGPS